MRTSVITAAVVTIGLIACTQSDRPAPTEHSTTTAESHRGARTPAATRHFSAHLNAGQETEPVDSRAQGQARLRLSQDGEALHFSINVANIVNITQAHIHLAPRGEDGPIVAWLRPEEPPAILLPGRFSGPFAEGTITSGDLVGPLEGEDLSALIDAMVAGNTYINVHTSAFPLGEIRGQIRRQGGPH